MILISSSHSLKLLDKFLISIILLLLVISFSNDSAYAKTSERFSAIIYLSDDTWKVGDSDVEITLNEMDLNRNPNSIETISVVNAYDIIPITFEEDGEVLTNSQSGSLPSIDIGGGGFKLGATQVIFQNNQVPQRYAGGAVVFSINNDSSLNSGDSLIFKNAMGRFYDYTIPAGSDISNLAFYINYDISVIQSNISSGKINSFSILLEDDTSSVLLVQSNKFKDFIKISPEKIAEIKSTLSSDNSLNVKFTFDNVEANTIIKKDIDIPVIFDVNRVGYYGDGSKTNQYFFQYTVRLELIETGPDTGIFKGKMSYQKLSTSKLSLFDYVSLDREGNEVVVPVLSMNDIEVSYFDHADASGETMEIGAGMGVDMRSSEQIIITLQEDTKTTVNLPPEIFDGYSSGTKSGIINNKVVYHNSTFGDLMIKNKKIQFQPQKDIFGKFNEPHTFEEYVFPSLKHYSLSGIMINYVITPTDDPITLEDMTIQSISLDEDSIATIPIVNQCSKGMVTLMNCKVKSNNLNEINIINNDLDALSFVVVKSPAYMTVSGTNSLKLTPTKDFFGLDTMSIKLSDGKNNSDELTLNISINSKPDIPVANAGIDQSVNEDSIVSLDGSQSKDVDGDTITYSWIQTSGDPVTLTDSKISNPKFTTPKNPGQLTFMLTTSDGTATSNPDVINIYVGKSVPIPVPPPSPTKIVATPANGAINLKWSPPAKDGGSPIIDYVIEYKSTTDTSWKIFADGKSTNTQTTITGLKNDVKYQFVISAVNSVGSGEKSTPSNAIPKSITVTPDPKILADEKKTLEDKKLAEKKAAEKKLAEKKAAEKKAAEKKLAEKKAAEKKAAEKKAAEKKLADEKKSK